MAILGSLPNPISNGQTADAVPLMADLNFIVNGVNANAAELSLTPQLANANTFTAVQSGVSATAAANFPIASQVQNASLTTLSSVAGANTITARIQGLPLGAYSSNQVFSFVPTANNSGAATINIDSLGAITLGRSLNSGFTALGSNDLLAQRMTLIGLTSTATRARVLNPVSEFDPGTRLLFQQTTAPTGWTKETSATYNDAALRFQTGTVTTGGANGFIATMNAAGATAGFTLTTAEISSHLHRESDSDGNAVSLTGGGGGASRLQGTAAADGVTAQNTQLTGGGGSHSHTLNSFNLKFVDVVVATKD